MGSGRPPIRHPLRMVWVAQTPHPSSVTDGIGGAKDPSVHCYGRNRDRPTDTDDGSEWPTVRRSSVRPEKGNRPSFFYISMSAPASEGVTEGRQDDDDVLGFPGDGFVDNTDANPDVLGEQDEEGDDSRMDEAGAASSQGSGKKCKKSAVLAPDAFVTDRIKALKRVIEVSNYRVCMLSTNTSPALW